MKRNLFVVGFALLLSLSCFSQGVYFDIGFGLGKATTEVDGVDVSKDMGSSVTETAINLGMKIGYGPVFNVPLYIVGEFSGMGHRFEDSYNKYLQFNSYLIGPGVIFYPVSFFQLGASFGGSFVANSTNLPADLYGSESGYAGNISAAFDIGKGNHGCLLGVMYYDTVNKLKVSGVKQESSLLCVFVKYAYRHKAKAIEKSDW